MFTYLEVSNIEHSDAVVMDQPQPESTATLHASPSTTVTEVIGFQLQNTVYNTEPFNKWLGPKKSRGEIAKNSSRFTLSEEDEIFVRQNFDMSCDFCAANNFKTFFDVQTHYMDEHQFSKGYIKSCCGSKKLYMVNQVRDHIDFHLNPDQLKCVQ